MTYSTVQFKAGQRWVTGVLKASSNTDHVWRCRDFGKALQRRYGIKFICMYQSQPRATRYADDR